MGCIERGRAFAALGSMLAAIGLLTAALPARAVDPPSFSQAEAARQLMDYAESHYGTLFPGHPATQTLDNIVYRRYEATGVYLGVALSSGNGFTGNGVYGLGGDFGPAPKMVGLLTQFITPKAQRVTVELANNDVVADPARGVFYASVPASVVGQGNRIATIDALSGAVSYSAPVGSEPFQLALAADGKSLYVALKSSGEIVRLSLPAMQSLGKVRLPSGNGGSGQYIAESIAASPTEPGVLAVALRNTQYSPRHQGVVLLRDMVLQPRQAGAFLGSNLITFNAAGTQLVGTDIESSDRGLFRIPVLADGLGAQERVTSHGSGGFDQISRAGDAIVIGRALWNAADLTLRGQYGVELGDCRGLATSGVLCLNKPFGGTPSLVRGETVALSLLEAIKVDSSGIGLYDTAMVPGPSATAALRPYTDTSGSAARLVIVRDEMMR